MPHSTAYLSITCYLCQAAELLELVSPKISEEQLQRKLDYKVAQEYDDEVACLVGCCWILLDVVGCCWAFCATAIYVLEFSKGLRAPCFCLSKFWKDCRSDVCLMGIYQLDPTWCVIGWVFSAPVTNTDHFCWQL